MQQRTNTRTSPVIGIKRRQVEREIRFFPQFRISKGVQWNHVFPIDKDHGFKTIEECNEEIDAMERGEERATGKVSEWRIKEQLV